MIRAAVKDNVSAAAELRLSRLDALSWLLDAALQIPGTRFRVGLDGLLGLLPGVGDCLTALLSLYIIFEAGRLGAPRRLLVRMLGNVALDTLIGVVPIFGDIFDIAWKSNIKNVALLRRHRDLLGRGERSPRQVLGFFLVVLILAFSVMVAATVVLLRLLYQLIASIS